MAVSYTKEEILKQCISEVFRLLADVLVTGEAARYQPSEEPNTHWKNWLDSGSL
jgi:hypothetical protein